VRKFRRILLASALASLVATSTYAADLEVTVLDAGLDRPQPLSGAIASLTTSSAKDASPSATTVVSGIADLTSLTAGTRVLRVTGPSGYATLEVQVELSPSSNSLIVLLPHVPEGISETVIVSSEIVQAEANVEDTLVPNARLNIAALTALSGATGSPEVSLYPVNRALTPAPFPGELSPRRLWALQPGGLTFGGATLRLPNEEDLPAGTSSTLWSYSALGGAWVQIGTATVDSTGTYLESEGAVVTQSGYLALDSGRPLVNAEFSLALQGPGGSPLSGASVTLLGHTVPETSTPGTYASTAFVTTGTPVRAFVTKDFGGLRLSGMTRPTLALPFTTQLNQGEALRLGLSCQSLQPTSVASFGATVGTGFQITDFTGVVSAAPVTTVTGSGPTYSSAVGPLQQAYPSAKPHHPLVEFALAPGSTGAAEDRYVPFSLTVSDADFTTRGHLVEVKFNFDGSDTVFPYTATILRGDRGPYRAIENGRIEYLLVWDRFASFPSNSTGAQDVKLQVTFADEPSGQQVLVVSESFSVEYPAPLEIVRVDPDEDATGVLIDSEVRVQFDQPLDASTVTTTNFKVFDGATELTSTTATLLASGEEVRITRSVNWPVNTLLTVQVATAVESTSGSTLGSISTSEFTTGTAEGLADSDSDGLLDLEEAHYGLDATLPVGGSASDWDGDGISDYNEIFVTFTDPKNADTDGDGLEDGDVLELDPLVHSGGALPGPAVAAIGSFSVVRITPASSATVGTDTAITITFSNPVDTNSVTTSNLKLRDVTGAADLAYSLEPSPNPHTLVISADNGLVTSNDYEVQVSAGGISEISSMSHTVAIAATSGFTTGSLAAQGDFEITKYMGSLGYSQWEAFPLTSATGRGGSGIATVVPVTGQLLLTQTDVSIPGRGMSVDVTRVYRSNAAAGSDLDGDLSNSGIFGKNWHFPLDQTMTSIANVNTDSLDDFAFRSGDGRRYEYTSSGVSAVSAFVSPPAFYDSLREVTLDIDGTGSDFTSDVYLQRRTLHGTIFYFAFPGTGGNKSPSSLTTDDVGYLVAVRDRNKNLTVIKRATSGTPKIESVKNDTGRTLTFDYTDLSNPDCVTSISLFQELDAADRRTWTYTYDASGRLLGVSTPSTDYRNEAGSTVTGAKSQTYSYTQSGATAQLTGLTDGRGNNTFRAFYDQEDNVYQVDYACGSDSGTAYFSYERTASTNVATQVDRNGNVSTIAHANGEAAPFFTISEAQTFTRGAHPYMVGAEPVSYLTKLNHDAQGEIIRKINPEGEVEVTIRRKAGDTCKCGCPKEKIYKAASESELSANPDAKNDQDIVYSFDYDHFFHFPIQAVLPRGNDPATYSTTVTTETWLPDANGDQGCRMLGISLPNEVREDYTVRTFYDHQIVEDELSGVLTEFLPKLNDLPASFGREGTNNFGDPDSPYAYPGGLDLAFPDEDGDGFPDRGGNPVSVRGPRPFAPLSGCNGTTQRQHVQQNFSYNEFGQRYYSESPEGELARVEYDTTAFSSSNVDAGLPVSVVVASGYDDSDLQVSDGLPKPGASGTSLDLQSSLTYNAFGNVLSATDPRGLVTTFEVNDLDLVTKVTTSAPFEHVTEFDYDGNNNRVRSRVENSLPRDLNDDGIQGEDEKEAVAEHPWFEHKFAFSPANMLVEQDLDAYGSSPERLITRHVYDCSQLLVATQEPAGNVHVWHYDERKLVYEQVLGSSDLTTCQRIYYDYDGAGRVAQVIDSDGNLDAQVRYEYDLQGRLAKATDELGNYVTSSYDAASNVRQRKVFDDLDNLLEHTVFSHDEANRVTQVARELWDPTKLLGVSGLNLTRVTPREDVSSLAEDPAASPSEFVHTLMAYDAQGRVELVCDDNAHTTAYGYDVASRLKDVTDPEGNVTTYTYDDASNVIRVHELQKRTDGGADENYYAERFYDKLNRLAAEVSNSGNTTRMLYDSRNNLVQVSDAMGDTTALSSSLPGHSEHGTIQVPSMINARGNTTRFVYDGISRPLVKHEDLRVGGVGAGAVINALTTSTLWDENSRVAARFDPKGNATTYRYDHQNRRILETFADGSTCRYLYNPNGTLAAKTDPRGVRKVFTYDLLERKTDMEVQNVPTGAGQTTFAAWTYDGLSRVTKAEDDDSICENTYDSLSRVNLQVQRIGTTGFRAAKGDSLSGETLGRVSRAFDGVGNLRQLWYPQHHSGTTPSGNAIERTYDDNDRLAGVKDGGSEFATFEHVGAGGRRTTRTYTPSGGTNMIRTASFDSERRHTDLDTRVGTTSGTVLARYQYTWDRANNRRSERRLASLADSTDQGDFYVYDSAYRLVHADLNVAGGNLPTATNTASVVGPSIDPTKAIDYHLDASGNRTQVDVFGSIKPYVLEVGAPTHDSALNQYSAIEAMFRSHDKSGNVTEEEGTQRFFDCDDRMVQQKVTGADVRYHYDAEGRRIMKRDADGSPLFDPILYFWDGWQCIEETKTNGNANKTFVFGEGIDEVLKGNLIDVSDSNGDSDMTDFVDLYYHHNSIGSVMAVTDFNGNVEESYTYRPYGEVEVRDENGTVISSTDLEQPFMFTGRRLDFEEGAGLYYYRQRYYDAGAGRFVSRDPLGMWGDSGQRGNAQNYCANNPVNRVDPLGLDDSFDATEMRKIMSEAKAGAPGARDRLVEYARRNEDYREALDDFDDAITRYEAAVERQGIHSNELLTYDADIAERQGEIRRIKDLNKMMGTKLSPSEKAQVKQLKGQISGLRKGKAGAKKGTKSLNKKVKDALKNLDGTEKRAGALLPDELADAAGLSRRAVAVRSLGAIGGLLGLYSFYQETQNAHHMRRILELASAGKYGDAYGLARKHRTSVKLELASMLKECGAAGWVGANGAMASDLQGLLDALKALDKQSKAHKSRK